MMHQESNPAIVGTFGGTILSIVPNLKSDDLIRTIFLAIIGAVVSFSISVLLKYLHKKYKK